MNSAEAGPDPAPPRAAGCDKVRVRRRQLTPAEARLRAMGIEEPDDGHPSGRDGTDEEDYAPPVYGWPRDPEGRLIRP